MYKTSYEQISRESVNTYRKSERDALMSAVRDIKSAIEIDPRSIDTIKACANLQKIWTILLTDVVTDGNKLSDEVKAGVISVGIWIQREISDIMAGKSNNYKGVIEITQIIADGLV